MTIKQPRPVDLHVGGRIRLRRKDLGMSQEALAEAIDLTFQQVQKYERGANRVSASMLHDIAIALRTPVAWFFEGLPQGEPVEATELNRADVHAFMMTTEGVELARLFVELSGGFRRLLLTIARGLLKGETV